MAKNNMKRFMTWYSQDIGTYKRFAESKRTESRFYQEELTDIYNKGVQYFKERRERGEPFTVTGLQRACGCNRTAFYRMKRQDYDWRLYQFMDYKGVSADDIFTEYDDILCMDVAYWCNECGETFIMNMYSEIIEHFYLLLEDDLEQRLHTAKNPVGIIFLLKSVFGWQDGYESQRTENITVHVATSQEAVEAVKMLG